MMFAFILMAGSGSRMQSDLPKQYLALNGKPLFWHSLDAFCNVPLIQKIYLVLQENDSHFARFQHWPIFKNNNIALLYCGGKTRAQSVRNALNQVSLQANNWVLIHDAARALIDSKSIIHLIEEAQNDSVGALLATPLCDTLKKQENGKLTTLSRENLWLAQTPQMFRYALLKQALLHLNDSITDEASAIEQMGLTPKIVPNTFENFKITHQQDLKIATQLLQGDSMNLRIGEGFDVHQMVENRPLILAGVEIDFEKGLLGHSDADALIHAIIDALLGAAALGDIGKHFPDSDAQFHNANSRILLKQTHFLIQQAGFEIINIDATIIAQRPKLQTYLPKMCTNIAQDLNLQINQINIKAKTNEKLGYLGQEQGIETRAVCLLKSI